MTYTYRIQAQYTEQGKRDGWLVIETCIETNRDFVIDHYPTKAMAAQVMKNYQATN